VYVVKCNSRESNQIFNFCAAVPEKYYANAKVRTGVLKVLTLAGIGIGWEGRAECICSSVDLLQLALGLIGEATGNKPISARQGR
jgi:hypothetical protein